jgi:hypothetical protein
MKSLAEKFCVTSTRLASDAKPADLRLLVQPLYRFDSGTDAKLPDGAMFGFSEGTDPLGLLLFEVRKSKDGARWHYAFTRLASFAITAEYGGKEVYSVDKYRFNQDRNATFLVQSGRLRQKNENRLGFYLMEFAASREVR